MAKAYRKEDFDYIMSKVAKVDQRVKEYLEDAGELPILGFLEEVRILFSAWNCKNNEIASYTNTTLGRRFEEILTLNEVKALRMTVKPAGSYLYCVYESGRRYIIDIERDTCNCDRYQIDEIPCPHEIAVLKSKNEDVKDYGRYCSELYRPNTIVKIYELPIVLMPEKKDWNVPVFVDDEKFCHPNIKDRLVGQRKEDI
ncbi:hypothetical protein P3S68_022094 [Capsicum galapagoense]